MTSPLRSLKDLDTAATSICKPDVVWQWESDYENHYHDFDEASCRKLESAYNSGQKQRCRLDAQGCRPLCEVCVVEMCMVDGLIGLRRSVLRLNVSPTARGTPTWQWKGDARCGDNAWSLYNRIHADALEAGFQSNDASIDLSRIDPQHNYVVDLKLMQQTNRNTGYKRAVRRLMNTKPDEVSRLTNTMPDEDNSLLWLAENLSSVTVVTNSSRFQCPICFIDCEPGDGVTLRECAHEFCQQCIRDYIGHSNEPSIKCPYKDDNYSCSYALLDVEVKELAPEYYATYLQHSLSLAESQEPRSFHCKTPDCRGWCIYEDDLNFFRCPVCKKKNCLTCKAIHEGKNCKQYQDDIKARCATNKEAQETQAYLEGLLKNKEAMECPGCKVIIQKKFGCDAMTCTMCKMELCWATMMPRWGPKGKGDTSGGCRCNVDFKPCHPKCQGCH